MQIWCAEKRMKKSEYPFKKKTEPELCRLLKINSDSDTSELSTRLLHQ